MNEFVGSFLQKYLGRFLKGEQLQKGSIDISLWNGEVTLRDIELQDEGLFVPLLVGDGSGAGHSEFGLRVRRGRLGLVRVQLPRAVWQWAGAPPAAAGAASAEGGAVRLQVQGLELELEPHVRPSTESALAAAAAAARVRALAAYEAERAAGGRWGAASLLLRGLLARLAGAAEIHLERLLLVLHVPLPDAPVRLAIQLEQLLLVRAAADPLAPTPVGPVPRIIKQLVLRGLSLSVQRGSRAAEPEPSEPLLRNWELEARLDLPSAGGAQTLAHVRVQAAPLDLSLSSRQARALATIAEWARAVPLRQRYGWFAPELRLVPAALWRHAIAGVVRDIRARSVRPREQLERRLAYRQAYRTRSAAAESLQQSLSTAEVLLCRALEDARSRPGATPAALRRWWHSLVGGPQDDATAAAAAAEATADLQAHAPAQLHFRLELTAATIRLDADAGPLAELQLGGVSAEWQSANGQASLSVTSASARDMHTRDSQYPLLLKTRPAPLAGVWLHAMVSNHGQTVTLQVGYCQAVLHLHWLARVVGLMQLCAPAAPPRLPASLQAQRIAAARDVARAAFAIRQQQQQQPPPPTSQEGGLRVELAADEGLDLLVPDDVRNTQAAALVLHLAAVHVQPLPEPLLPSPYASHTLRISPLVVALFSPSESNSTVPVMQPLQLALTLDLLPAHVRRMQQRAGVADAALPPLVRVFGELPQVQARLGPRQLAALMRIFLRIAFFVPPGALPSVPSVGPAAKPDSALAERDHLLARETFAADEARLAHITFTVGECGLTLAEGDGALLELRAAGVVLDAAARRSATHIGLRVRSARVAVPGAPAPLLQLPAEPPTAHALDARLLYRPAVARHTDLVEAELRLPGGLRLWLQPGDALGRLARFHAAMEAPHLAALASALSEQCPSVTWATFRLLVPHITLQLAAPAHLQVRLERILVAARAHETLDAHVLVHALQLQDLEQAARVVGRSEVSPLLHLTVHDEAAARRLRARLGPVRLVLAAPLLGRLAAFGTALQAGMPSTSAPRPPPTAPSGSPSLRPLPLPLLPEFLLADARVCLERGRGDAFLEAHLVRLHLFALGAAPEPLQVLACAGLNTHERLGTEDWRQLPLLQPLELHARLLPTAAGLDADLWLPQLAAQLQPVQALILRDLAEALHLALPAPRAAPPAAAATPAPPLRVQLRLGVGEIRLQLLCEESAVSARELTELSLTRLQARVYLARSSSLPRRVGGRRPERGRGEASLLESSARVSLQQWRLTADGDELLPPATGPSPLLRLHVRTQGPAVHIRLVLTQPRLHLHLPLHSPPLQQFLRATQSARPSAGSAVATPSPTTALGPQLRLELLVTDAQAQVTPRHRGPAASLLQEGAQMQLQALVRATVRGHEVHSSALLDGLTVRVPDAALTLAGPFHLAAQYTGDNQGAGLLRVDVGAIAFVLPLRLLRSTADLLAEQRRLHAAARPQPPSVASALQTITSPPAPAALPVNPVATPELPTEVVLVWQKLSGTLLHDVAGVDVPMLGARLGHIRGRAGPAGERGTTMQLEVADVSGKAYNLALGVWEPLLEPYAFELRAHTRPHLHLALESKAILNLNVTRALLDLALAREPQQAGLAPSVQGRTFYPVVLRNETGVAVEWLVTSSLQPATGEVARLASGEEVGLVAAPSGKSGAVLSYLPSFSLALSLPQFHRVDGLPLHTLTSRVLPLLPTGAHASAWLLYQVILRGATKVVVIAAPHVVENRTSEPLELLLPQYQLAQPGGSPWAAVPPCARQALPLHAPFALQLRPQLAGRRLDWSAEVAFPEAPAPPACLVTCDPLPGTREAHTYALAASLLDGVKQLVVAAPLRIRNLLPLPLFFLLAASAGAQTAVSGWLGRDEQRPVHDLSADAWASGAMLLSLNVAGGYAPCEDVPVAELWNKLQMLGVPAMQRRVRLTHRMSRPLFLELDLALGPAGELQIDVWCRYWLVNLTGVPLLFRRFTLRTAAAQAVATATAGQSNSGAGLEAETDEDEEGAGEERAVGASMGSGTGEVELFSFRRDYGFPPAARHLVQVRVAPGPLAGTSANYWSRPLSLAAPSQELVLRVGHAAEPAEPAAAEAGAERDGGGRLYLGVSTALDSDAGGRRTRVVRFVCRYRVTNRLGGRTLLYRQVLSPAVATLESGASAALHWPVEAAQPLLALGLEHHWTGGFRIDQPGDFVLKIEQASGRAVDEKDEVAGSGAERARRRTFELVRVQVAEEDGTWQVRVLPAPAALPPFRLENCSRCELELHQAGAEEHARLLLGPYEACPYAWCSMAAPHRLVLAVPALSVARDFPLHKLKCWQPAFAAAPQLPFRVETFADGPVRVLRFVDAQLHTSPAVRAPLPAVPGQPPATVLLPEEIPHAELALSLAGLGVSLVDAQPEELLYLSAQQLQLGVQVRASSVSSELVLARLQVDNQTRQAVHPVLLQHASAAVRGRLVQWRAAGALAGVVYVPLVQLEVPPLTVRLDERLLVRLLHFFALPVGAGRPAAESESGELSSPLVYLDRLSVNTLQVALTFTPLPGSAESRDELNPMRRLWGLGGLAANLDDAPVALEALDLRHPFCTLAELRRRVGAHYLAELLDELYKVLGASALLGNPTSLLSNVFTGLRDFVYEPAAALQTPSLGRLGSAMRKGTASLVRRSVYGVCNSTSKLVSSVGSGLALLSFDDEFLRARSAQHVGVKPRDATEGLAQGVQELGQGVLRGVTGLLTQPVRGARRAGLGGFVAGLARGAVGVALQPAVGAVDLLARTSQGLAALAAVDGPEPARVRPPRHFGLDRILHLYALDKAYGQAVLHSLDAGRHAHDAYVYHAQYGEYTMLLVSASAVFSLYTSRPPTVEWRVPFKKLQQVERRDDGLVLHVVVKQGLAGDGGGLLLGHTAVKQHHVAIADRRLIATCHQRIEAALRHWRLTHQLTGPADAAEHS